MEEVSHDVEPPMKRESSFHSVRTSHGIQCASMRRKAVIVRVPMLYCKIYM